MNTPFFISPTETTALVHLPWRSACQAKAKELAAKEASSKSEARSTRWTSAERPWDPGPLGSAKIFENPIGGWAIGSFACFGALRISFSKGFQFCSF